jgi:hypothetical protein
LFELFDHISGQLFALILLKVLKCDNGAKMFFTTDFDQFVDVLVEFESNKLNAWFAAGRNELSKSLSVSFLVKIVIELRFDKLNALLKNKKMKSSHAF